MKLIAFFVHPQKFMVYIKQILHTLDNTPYSHYDAVTLQLTHITEKFDVVTSVHTRKNF